MIAETVAKALGGRKSGSAWMALCPAHEDREPSLSITDAGCDQEQVIAALRSRGLWMESGPRRFTPFPPRGVVTRSQPDRDNTKRTETALAIWSSARPAGGTLVETYLLSRGLHLSPPPRLRFHVGLKHPSGGIWPAIVALVTRGSDDMPTAIHRTFLALDGCGKAPVVPQKMMFGPCHSGAVRLATPSNMLMLGEGVETCLAAMQATGHPAWAALSTSGLRALDLPTHVRELIVLADGDDAGEAAARECAWRWKREGRRVRIARPPQGMDFNDLLVGQPRTAKRPQ
jgi:putative DNA primase/helicase